MKNKHDSSSTDRHPLTLTDKPTGHCIETDRLTDNASDYKTNLQIDKSYD